MSRPVSFVTASQTELRLLSFAHAANVNSRMIGARRDESLISATFPLRKSVSG